MKIIQLTILSLFIFLTSCIRSEEIFSLERVYSVPEAAYITYIYDSTETGRPAAILFLKPGNKTEIIADSVQITKTSLSVEDTAELIRKTKRGFLKQSLKYNDVTAGYLLTLYRRPPFYTTTIESIFYKDINNKIHLSFWETP